MTASKPKPRLKNLDDLFLLGGDNALDAPNSEAQRVSQIRRQSEVAIDLLTPFAYHPFRLYDGERLDDMVDSVRKNGVLVPIIVRKAGDGYEILSGHNRVNAAKLAGLEKVPAVILESIPDDEAWIYVIETNLMQRSFTDMAHSEKAAVIAMQHTKLFSQGKRNDILVELKTLENSHEYRENRTSSQVGTELRTDEKVGIAYSMSRNTVARYVRIHKLIEALKARLDNGEIASIPAVTLSFLKESEQTLLDKCMELNGFTVDMRKTDILRQYSEKGKLDSDSIFLILNGELWRKPKPNRTPTVKVSKAVYAKYFRPNQSAQEIRVIASPLRIHQPRKIIAPPSRAEQARRELLRQSQVHQFRPQLPASQEKRVWQKYIGYPYVYGGSSPSTSFDCSGFVCWVVNKSGVGSVGRTTAQGLYNLCTPISAAEAKAGDLVFFHNTYNHYEHITHVGIFIEPGIMLHAGNPTGYVNYISRYGNLLFSV